MCGFSLVKRKMMLSLVLGEIYCGRSLELVSRGGGGGPAAGLPSAYPRTIPVGGVDGAAAAQMGVAQQQQHILAAQMWQQEQQMGAAQQQQHILAAQEQWWQQEQQIVAAQQQIVAARQQMELQHLGQQQLMAAAIRAGGWQQQTTVPLPQAVPQAVPIPPPEPPRPLSREGAVDLWRRLEPAMRDLLWDVHWMLQKQICWHSVYFRGGESRYDDTMVCTGQMRDGENPCTLRHSPSLIKAVRERGILFPKDMHKARAFGAPGALYRARLRDELAQGRMGGVLACWDRLYAWREQRQQ